MAEGLAEGTTAHEFPSHRSVSVPCPEIGSEEVPTAQQSDADTHVTPLRRLPCEASGMAEVTRAHEVPSQCSMSACSAPLKKAPTAQQSDADAHATPNRLLFCVAEVLAEVTSAHEVPSQCSMSVWAWPDGGFMMISSK